MFRCRIETRRQQESSGLEDVLVLLTSFCYSCNHSGVSRRERIPPKCRLADNTLQTCTKLPSRCRPLRSNWPQNSFTPFLTDLLA